jgi:hypothetical protein
MVKRIKIERRHYPQQQFKRTNGLCDLILMIHVNQSKRGLAYVLQNSEISLFLFAVVVSAEDHLLLAKNSCILYGEEN